jgi:hypothetical protein
MVATMIGTTTMIAGSIIFIAADPCTSSGLLLQGGFAFVGGLAMNVLGIPVWLLGTSRKQKLKSSTFYDSSRGGTVHLTPSLNKDPFHNTYSLGLSAILSF